MYVSILDYTFDTVTTLKSPVFVYFQEKRYVIAGVSIDTPECPPEKDCIRGKVRMHGFLF